MSRPELNPEALLTKPEMKIRNMWVFILISKTAFVPLTILLNLFKFSNNNQAEIFGTCIGYLVSAFLTSGVLYILAHQRYGTKYLTWMLFATFCSQISTLQVFFSDAPLDEKITFGFDSILFVFFWIYSLRLREVNKIIQTSLLRPLVASEISAKFGGVSTIEEANLLLENGLRDYPKDKDFVRREFEKLQERFK